LGILVDMNEELRDRLVLLVEEENRLKTELASDGSLYEGYLQKPHVASRTGKRA
jgi:hypothetical protein